MKQLVHNRRIVEMSPAEYHAADAVSSGGLKCYAKEGPLMYHAKYVSRTADDKDSDAKRLGRAFHSAMEHGEWENLFCILPDIVGDDDELIQSVNAQFEGTKSKRLTSGEEINLRLPTHRVYLDAITLSANLKGLEVLSKGEGRVIQAMVESVFENPAAAEYVGHGQSEIACFGQCELTGLPVKALGDLLQPERVIDFKTTRQSTVNGWRDEALRKLSYQYQAEWYMRVFGVEEFVFITVRNEPPWESMVYTLNYDDCSSSRGPLATPVGDQMRSVKDANEYTLHAIKDCYDTDSWHSLYWGAEIPLAEPGRLMQ